MVTHLHHDRNRKLADDSTLKAAAHCTAAFHQNCQNYTAQTYKDFQIRLSSDCSHPSRQCFYTVTRLNNMPLWLCKRLPFQLDTEGRKTTHYVFLWATVQIPLLDPCQFIHSPIHTFYSSKKQSITGFLKVVHKPY